MRARRPIRCLILLLAVAPGCQTLYGYRPLEVEARDAETQQPIAGVSVRISYPLETSALAPAESKAATGADGIAHVQAAPYGEAGIMLEVSAKGYASEVKYLSVEEVQAIEPAHWFEDANVRRRPGKYVMELFADPAPTIELIAPVGYRGPIKAKILVQADAPATQGQRLFRFAVPDSREVEAKGPAVFRNVNSSGIRVRFADDRPLTLRAKESDLGYWFVKNEGGWHYFFVGTPTDHDAYLRSLQSEGSLRGRQADGKSRRGRKSDE